MGKRLCDLLLSVLALALAWPLIAAAMLLIWGQDRAPPLYWSARVGQGGREFRMVKLRTMITDAERRGGPSTSRSDVRITPLGRALRRCKLDELPQFWNVLRGQMSIVGPRPNVRLGGVEAYTTEEMELLRVRPGITDLSSIVFSDEADILDGADDPDARYQAVIRPWKSRLGLLYVARHDPLTDLNIIGLTAVSLLARPLALRGVDAILARWAAADDLRRICRRREPPPAGQPPGWAA